ncbi:hypothetical protein BU26DRAFT_518746 [Trematosphaeria pertusa]|uniref:Uncharacterized protein n=1 Tax=Trematosphaeria pertusa TaxID=390896 RepID=A0A6A6ILC9_9PLEO|nr:uncharacterized protein BU26DRAFT_518746 [Trematosphaeria pertusa]KAF2250350.1 hypothetical protein BU26DRAFT_518746 [Trematosphaeria pertusa]
MCNWILCAQAVLPSVAVHAKPRGDIGCQQYCSKDVKEPGRSRMRALLMSLPFAMGERITAVTHALPSRRSYQPKKTELHEPQEQSSAGDPWVNQKIRQASSSVAPRSHVYEGAVPSRCALPSDEANIEGIPAVYNVEPRPGGYGGSEE